MDVPEAIRTSTGYVFDGLEAFCLLCARLRSAGDMYELVKEYNRSQAAISEIVNDLVEILDERWKHLLDFDIDGAVSQEALAKYAAAIFESGAPVHTVWGFIDCTIRRICRPTSHQRQAYNGHKKHHAVKYQAVVAPDGRVVHLYGPVEGRRADPGILNDSLLIERCTEHAFMDDEDGGRTNLQLFGDSAYGISQQMLSPYSGAGERTDDELEWNVRMGSVRVKVEHIFGIVTKTWPFLNAWWKMQVYRSPVGRYYRVGVLLANALNCFRPNQVSRAFNLPPPLVHEYFHD